MGFAFRLVVLGVAACALVGVAAEPAAAHGVGGVDPSNYETTITRFEPGGDGVELHVRDVGDRLELVNTSDGEVTVLGYEDEPYLRVGPEGVYENRNSPAVVLNRDRYATDEVPPEYDATLDPDWERISGGTSVRWHDHRAHWMGENDPAAVRDDPGSSHTVIEDFEVPFLVGRERVVAVGDVVWVPGPAQWPWFLGALGLAVLVVAATRTRHWPLVLTVALAVLIAVEIAHVVGLWQGTTGTLGTQLGANAYSFAGIAVGGAAVFGLVAARDPSDTTPVVLVAAIILTVAGGLADLSTLGASQLPTTLPDELARAGVMLALGLGVGVGVAAAMRLRPARPADRRRVATDAPAAPPREV